MLKRINDLLAGLPMTILSGVLLALCFILRRMGLPAWPVPAWGSVLISGIPLLYLALWRVVHNKGISKISSALLITMAMLAAIAIGDLFAAGEVAFIMSLGALLEERTTARARKGLHNLLRLTPQEGRLIRDGREKRIPAEHIQSGDLLRVLPGEAIPADGVIVQGETSVDQSILTGESLPVDRGPGDEVFCGTLNRFGAVDLRATRAGEDSSLRRLIQMVRDAEERQAPMQRIADWWASWLVPIALLIALVTALVTHNLVRGVTVLVVFCPCALVLATPTAIMAAIGQATRHGILIKSGEALERMGRVNTIALDKTGTLTCGTLQVSDVISLTSDLRDGDLLLLAGAAEARSEHPLGQAITACARAHYPTLPESKAFRMDTGRGVTAMVSGRQLYLGNESYLTGFGIPLNAPAQAQLAALRAQGKAAVLIADSDHCLGILALSDTLRPDAADMVRRLSALHTRTVLLTGDNRQTADYFAAQAGIAQVHAGLLPEQKLEHITALQANQRPVCMIGDGVNDAPALKAASVGVAMGSMGSDIAVEAADIALMGDELSKIPYLKWLSDTTVRTIRLGIILSMCINFAAVTCSVAGILTPTTGALVHNAGSCLVVLIAALLYDRKYPAGDATASGNSRVTALKQDIQLS